MILSRNTPDFISSLQWLPNSPDLKLVDYTIWGKLQKRVYRTRIHDVDHLVERCVRDWSIFDHEIICAAVTQWQARLRPYSKADKGHFEHFLWQLMNDHTASLEITERVVCVHHIFLIKQLTDATHYKKWKTSDIIKVHTINRQHDT